MKTKALRELVKSSTVFNWTAEAQAELDSLKVMMDSLCILAPHDHCLPFLLWFDASYEGGFGYVLKQQPVQSTGPARGW